MMTETLRAETTSIEGVLVVQPPVFGDSRGTFFEAWHHERYRALGIPGVFVQDNVSRSRKGTLRGLHLQEPHGQGKLVHVMEGEVFDVAVDVRVGSPTFGQWVGEYLSAENHRQLYIPPGLAHGFCVLSEFATFSYKCTDYYRPDTELSIVWNDPQLGVVWPVVEPMLSSRDAAARRLSDIPLERLPRWRPVVSVEA